ncbi:MAG TPA: hypothetical protein VGT05_00175 [Patescibacteria group bacterium]|nr:hypothetical protein [Patescibacteria group bacterium]
MKDQVESGKSKLLYRAGSLLRKVTGVERRKNQQSIVDISKMSDIAILQGLRFTLDVADPESQHFSMELYNPGFVIALCNELSEVHQGINTIGQEFSRITSETRNDPTKVRIQSEIRLALIKAMTQYYENKLSLTESELTQKITGSYPTMTPTLGSVQVARVDFFLADQDTVTLRTTNEPQFSPTLESVYNTEIQDSPRRFVSTEEGLLRNDIHQQTFNEQVDEEITRKRSIIEDESETESVIKTPTVPEPQNVQSNALVVSEKPQPNHSKAKTKARQIAGLEQESIPQESIEGEYKIIEEVEEPVYQENVLQLQRPKVSPEKTEDNDEKVHLEFPGSPVNYLFFLHYLLTSQLKGDIESINASLTQEYQWNPEAYLKYSLTENELQVLRSSPRASQYRMELIDQVYDAKLTEPRKRGIETPDVEEVKRLAVTNLADIIKGNIRLFLGEGSVSLISSDMTSEDIGVLLTRMKRTADQNGWSEVSSYYGQLLPNREQIAGNLQTFTDYLGRFTILNHLFEPLVQTQQHVNKEREKLDEEDFT